MPIEHAAPLLDRRNCRIEPEIDQTLPPVAGDFGQLLQLADNLIGNAIRYGCNDKSCAVEVDASATMARGSCSWSAIRATASRPIICRG